MEQDFWHNVWQKNTIGFHQDEIHPFLTSHINSIFPTKNESIFVPFCGKSKDMLWLNQFGSVTGAELSEIACRDFFEENNISFDIDKDDCMGLKQYVSVDNGISIWQGDYFSLTAEIVNQSYSFIYDRAALIALPKNMRGIYANKLKEFMNDNTQLLLISLEYPEHEMTGPPFPIYTEEIFNLFRGFQVETVTKQNLTGKKFAQRFFDVTNLVETLYLIRR